MDLSEIEMSDPDSKPAIGRLEDGDYSHISLGADPVMSDPAEITELRVTYDGDQTDTIDIKTASVTNDLPREIELETRFGWLITVSAGTVPGPSVIDVQRPDLAQPTDH
ncbi:hypothetical protein [Haloferax larsenii]|uniref:Uncharacterized protein n=1 Tax=Haloferax larsenii TaxID=302484 RepID=A0A1H7JAF7_HALLR|nr:hypothetical protein [Haloferax larsenii]SEK70285.1 hypothetical protein SAMN04488691_1011116 [Haloferax larsenii]